MAELKLLSFFSGSGLFDKGLIDAGYTILEANEINKNYKKCYEYAHKNNMPEKGINNYDFWHYIKDDELNSSLKYLIKHERKQGGLIGFVGGSPCIDFSTAGNNKGGDGIHGGLLGAFCHLIDDVAPDFFIIENVPGLLKIHNNYLTQNLMVLMKKFKVFYTLQNALNFGVPQSRERLFIIGSNKKLGIFKTFNIIKYQKYSIDYIKSISWPKKSPFGGVPGEPLGIPRDLMVSTWFTPLVDHPNQNQYIIHNPHRDITLDEGMRRKQSAVRLHRYKYSPTLSYGHSNIPAHYDQLRGCSIAECLSIQSLPINFALPQNIALGHIYQTITNGVPYLLSKGIGEALKDYLKND